MSYIHPKEEERTGFQSHCLLSPTFDVQCDFAMAYGVNDGTAAVIESYRAGGYRGHVMTGLAWGGYQEYLSGKWDGREHWDEGQEQRSGNPIQHNPTVPYMVPTIAFSDYLTEKLKKAVDAGAEAIHLEEPEFFAGGGYAGAFKREYELYYHRPWEWPEETAESSFSSFRLMARLYLRLIERVSAALKEYAKVTYNRNLRVYVATHSLINYAQWKIMSPESLLVDVPSVDGYIAQIWTGTSRVKNRYQGELRERTFETAFLEYGVMQEMVRGTGKEMWFLHDPVEDDPKHDWTDYRRNYQKTVAASLFHPAVARYEICPWPARIFEHAYPCLLDGSPTPEAVEIPDEYRTVLCNTMNLLSDMEETAASFEGVPFSVGLLLADSFLYQRWIPESVWRADPTGELQDADSGNMSNFYGMALPLLKKGLPLRPVVLDNVRRVAGYLDPYQLLVLSYECLKPETPDLNLALALWVSAGGALVYVGNGTDCFHRIPHWWTGTYHNPAEHLFECMGLPRTPAPGVHRVGKGVVSVLAARPAALAQSGEGAAAMYGAVAAALTAKGLPFTPNNALVMHRGAYVIAACLNESVSEEPLRLSGLFADMGDADLAVCREVCVRPGEERILFDLTTLKPAEPRIIGTSLRVSALEVSETGFTLTAKGSSHLDARIRLHLPHPVANATAHTAASALPLTWQTDTESATVLLCFPSDGASVTVTGTFAAG